MQHKHVNACAQCSPRCNNGDAQLRLSSTKAEKGSGRRPTSTAVTDGGCQKSQPNTAAPSRCPRMSPHSQRGDGAGDENKLHPPPCTATAKKRMNSQLARIIRACSFNRKPVEGHAPTRRRRAARHCTPSSYGLLTRRHQTQTRTDWQVFPPQNRWIRTPHVPSSRKIPVQPWPLFPAALKFPKKGSGNGQARPKSQAAHQGAGLDVRRL